MATSQQRHHAAAFHSDIEKGAEEFEFADAIVRRGFVRKVFGACPSAVGWC